MNTASSMPDRVRTYATCVIAGGAIFLCGALEEWDCRQPVEFLAFLLLAVAASLIKVRLPGMTATYSANAVVLLAGAVRFSPGEAVLAACAASVTQSFFRAQWLPRAVQVLFNAANDSISIALCALVAHRLLSGPFAAFPQAVLAPVAALFFVVNTVLVSGVLSLVDGKPLREVCRRWYDWSLPYYLLGASLVALLPLLGQAAAPQAWLMPLPVIYLVHCFRRNRSRGPGRAGVPSGASAPAGYPSPAPAQAAAPPLIPPAAAFYIAVVIGLAALVLVAALVRWETASFPRFAAMLVLVCTLATWKVKLPWLDGTVSPAFVVLLFGMARMSLAEVAILAGCASAMQLLWKRRGRRYPAQVAFNVSVFILSNSAALAVCRSLFSGFGLEVLVPYLLIATMVQYGLNSALMAGVMSLVERASFFTVWGTCHFWMFPYYLVGAAAAGLMIAIQDRLGWIPALLVLPLVALVYISCRVHFETRIAPARRGNVRPAAA